ncbi:hypothetical protein ALI44B_12840 [Leifsonia sp. ALI-44-B]|uniref:TipAS antibiotic-recognition domain-containing protein n=1 Tax=Leifsonia sp. ALI-44-B TaxID=1933776 RepID=UPI00097C78A7|nr:TipAS antibiotic-recognition domain-containing protein [Leifsonia sp. ALI-44-B]ONI61323.1 hypothetical protein ALI44B_12840 [Leifsonia sp. ALI-44-B]
MAENEFDGLGGAGAFSSRGDGGFEYGVHREEVERRWGAQAYADRAAWWRGLGEEGRQALQADTQALNETWQDAAARGIPVGGDEAQNLAGRHVRWLEAATEGHEVSAAYLTGLGDLYAADERFWPNYGDAAGAAFVREALAVFAERNLR